VLKNILFHRRDAESAEKSLVRLGVLCASAVRKPTFSAFSEEGWLTDKTLADADECG